MSCETQERSYSKIEILLKKINNNDPSILLTDRVEFFDAKPLLTGNYLIITKEDYDDTEIQVSITNKVFDLSNVASYKLHN